MIPLEGRDLSDVTDCMEFLREAKCDQSTPPDLSGKRVVVLGGGNVALDVARSSMRLGTASTTILCLEDRAHMPAHEWEVQEAIEEGVQVITSGSAKVLLTGDDGSPMLEYADVATIDFTPEGRLIGFTLSDEPGKRIPADVVIVAVGLAPSSAAFAGELDLTPRKTIAADPETLRTSDPIVFAGGDVVLGPSIIVEAMGQGRRAAYHIDEMLQGNDDTPPLLGQDPRHRQGGAAGGGRRHPRSARRPPCGAYRAQERIQSFEGYEGTLHRRRGAAARPTAVSAAVGAPSARSA